MKHLFAFSLLALMAGCHDTANQNEDRILSEKALQIHGNLVCRNGIWIDSLSVENDGQSDLVMGSNFIVSYSFVGSDGVGLVSWCTPLLQCHYVMLHPVVRGKRGFVSREQVSFEMPLETECLKPTSTAHIDLEVNGQQLIADGNSLVVTDVKLRLQQDLPSK